ncbi:hypothetical protein BDZ89DRAFT_1061337 [Hymenopellis radicata]|nr:hypothetical protein BDZ89DRAFT_1061337 [Hymenopellis radicata]
MFSSYLLCCLFWLAADFSLGRSPILFALCFSIMNACRLLLNIREVYFVDAQKKKEAGLGVDIDDTVLDTRQTKVIPLTPTSSQERWMYELRELRWTGR